MPELLLPFDVGEGRSEPLYIGTVVSSVMCEFNHALVESFSKASRLCAEAAHFLLTILLLGKGERFFIFGGHGEGKQQ